MKRNIIRLALCAMVGFVLASCGGTEVNFQEADLLGYWLEDGTQHYVRFTDSRQSDDYQLGYEWDESEDVMESDVKNNEGGNGWFKWALVKTNLTEIHLMDNGGAEIPKTYVVTKLTDTELAYYEKDQPSVKASFQKVVKKN